MQGTQRYGDSQPCNPDATERVPPVSPTLSAVFARFVDAPEFVQSPTCQITSEMKCLKNMLTVRAKRLIISFFVVLFVLSAFFNIRRTAEVVYFPDDPRLVNLYCNSNSVIKCDISRRCSSFYILLGVNKEVFLKVNDYKGWEGFSEYLINLKDIDIPLDYESSDGVRVVISSESVVKSKTQGLIFIYPPDEEHSLTNGFVKLINSNDRSIECEINFTISYRP